MSAVWSKDSHTLVLSAVSVPSAEASSCTGPVSSIAAASAPLIMRFLFMIVSSYFMMNHFMEYP